MPITLKILQKAADLAHLLHQDADLLLAETNLILKQITALHKVDVTGVEPMLYQLEAQQYWREDKAIHTDHAAQLAEIAPQFTAHHYVILKHLKER